MTGLFVYYLYFKHLRGVYGSAAKTLAFFGLFVLAVLLDDLGMIDLIKHILQLLARHAWAYIAA